MPGSARREIVADGEVGAYHCMARCVRRAYLCGRDSLTGKSFEHRKQWIEQSLEQLAGAFAIDVSSYAVMDNHVHVILRQRPDIAKAWSAEDVTRRWRSIFGKPAQTKQERDRLQLLVDAESANPKLVRERRQRLASISWFMRCLCEPIARRANREDGCNGRFWEGRFRSQALLDDAALLACSAYVDLNPVRAMIAKTPETSGYTSVYKRIQQRQSNARRTDRTHDGWLSPMLRSQCLRSKENRRASHDAMISLELAEYLKLLDWTGRQLRQDKRGAIPSECAPILDRLKLASGSWVELVKNFGKWFKHAAGSPAKLAQHAKQFHRSWLHGMTHSRATYL